MQKVYEVHTKRMTKVYKKYTNSIKRGLSIYKEYAQYKQFLVEASFTQISPFHLISAHDDKSLSIIA